MHEASAATKRRACWQGILLAAGLSLFGLLVYAAGPRTVLGAISHLGWLAPLLALPYFAAYLVDSVGWWWILSRRIGQERGEAWRAPNLLRLFGIRAAGEAVNAITPTAYFGGEPLKAWLLQGYGVPLPCGLASVMISKTALMLTQGLFVFLGVLIGLEEWRSAIPLPLAAGVGIALVALVCAGLVGAQRRGLFSLVLSLSRRLTGRQRLLASWEADLKDVDRLLHDFYENRLQDFSICCGFHLLGWVVGSLEVYVVLRMLGQPVDFTTAFAIEALSGVAKLAALFIPGSLGVQEGGQVLIFVAFGLTAPLAMTFGILRRCRELLWVGFGLAVIARRQALELVRGRGGMPGAGNADKEKGPEAPTA
ncbi:MAG: flippase-like domain-containing protein [Candidatus Methylomirabilota bacterium]